MHAAKPTPQGPSSTQFSLRFDEWGRLIFSDAEGGQHESVRIVRAFPITDPEHFISIVSATGHELVQIDALAALAPPERIIVTTELARREFLPQIRKILHVSGRIEPCEWQVETDRGAHSFVLNAYEDVHRLGPNRALIISGDAVRYLIADLRGLDRQSRGYLERYL